VRHFKVASRPPAVPPFAGLLRFHGSLCGRIQLDQLTDIGISFSLNCRRTAYEVQRLFEIHFGVIGGRRWRYIFPSGSTFTPP
jgi:hypothetical protein